LGNYLWLVKLTKALNDEYRYRYEKDVDHKSWTAVKDLPLPSIKNIGLTNWARAMPDECKIGNDSIASYQNYYRTNKQHILKYTKRQLPYFLIGESQ
jgi:tRNA A37 N6-isopentenylltransferase MiaA